MEEETYPIGIPLQSFIAVRKEASERSEMVSQLLFGECYDILSKESNWYKIRMHLDGYEGWIDKKLVVELSISEAEQLKAIRPFVLKAQTTPEIKGKGTINLFPGSEVWISSNDHEMQVKNTHIKFTGHVDKEASIEKIKEIFLNAPYLWGGRTPYGIDCSGLSQIACKMMGIMLPRDASKQVLKGETINFLEEAKPGDLAFFGDEENIHHVGILLDSNRILHASGWVKISKIDHQGIFEPELNAYTHHLRAVKRIKQ